MKILHRVFYGIAFLFLIYVLIINFVPDLVDRDSNKVVLSGPYEIDDETALAHQSIPFVTDLHCDVLLWDRDITDEEDFGHVDIPRMQRGNVALQAFTIVSKSPAGLNFQSNSADANDDITLLSIVQGRPVNTWFSLKERAIYQCEKLYKAAEDSGGEFRVITSVSDLRKFTTDRSNNPKLTAGYLGAEGAHILEANINNVQEMYDAGIRMMAPVHFFDNALGGSAHGVEKGGLTEFGKSVITKMEELNMIIDLAHASPNLIDDVMDMASKPLLVSHTGVKGTCDNIRNLSDEHIKRIARGGGLIGVAMFDTAVCGSSAKSTADAIKYVAELVGISHVGLGSDFDGSVTTHFDISGMALLTKELIGLGYSQPQINRIMGGNALQFLLNNLPKE